MCACTFYPRHTDNSKSNCIQFSSSAAAIASEETVDLYNNNISVWIYRGVSSSCEKSLSCVSIWKWSPVFNSHLKILFENQRKHLLNSQLLTIGSWLKKTTIKLSKECNLPKVIENGDKMRFVSQNNIPFSIDITRNTRFLTTQNQNLHFANEAMIVEPPISFTSLQIPKFTVQYPYPKFQFNHPHTYIFTSQIIHHKEISILFLLLFMCTCSNGWHSWMIYCMAFQSKIISKENWKEIQP